MKDHGPPLSRRHMLSLTAGAIPALSCAPGLAVAPPSGLDAIARSRGLRFGTAVSPTHLDDPAFAQLIVRECSVLTAENNFKWKYLEAKEGQRNPAKALRVLRFASRHRMSPRGHTFVWNQDDRVPGWLIANEAALAQKGGAPLIALMNDHARYLATTFPQIESWDCVNEAFVVQSGQLKNSIYTRILGMGFFDLAFQLMAQYAPHAQRVYNGNMSWEQNPDHRNAVLRVLEQALKRGVPVDAIGIQSHLGNTLGRGRDERAWNRFLAELDAMGMTVLITELDCADRHLSDQEPARRDAEIAAFVKGYLDITLSHRNVSQIICWGLSDRYSNLNRESYPTKSRRPDGLPMRGNPFDDALRPKPLYDAIAAALAACPVR